MQDKEVENLTLITLLDTLLIPRFGVHYTMPKCCPCIGSGSCVQCTCIKKGRNVLTAGQKDMEDVRTYQHLTWHQRGNLLV